MLAVRLLAIIAIISTVVLCCDKADCMAKTIEDSVHANGLIVSQANVANIDDSALSAILFQNSGKAQLSIKICNALAQLVEADGRIYDIYDVEKMTPLTSAITTRTSALAALALAKMYESTNEYKYLRGASAIADFIDKNLKSSIGGYIGGKSEDYRSAEQCVAVFVAARQLYKVTKDVQYSAMVDWAKKHLDSAELQSPEQTSSEIVLQNRARTFSWYLLADDNSQAASQVRQIKPRIGQSISNPAAIVDPDVTAALSMALYQLGEDNKPFVKYTLDKKATLRNKIWSVYMLRYLEGEHLMNPFSPKFEQLSDRSGDNAPMPDQSSSVRTGVIIAAATLSSIFLLCSVIVLFLLARKMRNRLLQGKGKPERIRIKTIVGDIDMRAVASPLSPVDENLVFSPSTPGGDMFSPYSPVGQLFRDQYHIVSPATPGYSPNDE